MDRGASRLDQIGAFNDPQDSGTLRESSPRQKTNQDDSSLFKRDRSPPRSPKYSSLSTEGVLERAEAVLRAINEKGCPTVEGVTF